MSRVEFSLGDILGVAKFIRETFLRVQEASQESIATMDPHDADALIASQMTRDPAVLIAIGEMRAKRKKELLAASGVRKDD